MVRTEKVVKKVDSDIKMPLKSKKKLSRAELDELIIRLAEAHGII